MIVDIATNIADNIHGIITISEFEKRIISTTIFNRLHNIHQNSTAYLTFPSNRTKRFEHSLGTMFLCSKIFFYSISNASDEILKAFFDAAREEINKTFGKIKNDSNYKSKLGGRFNRIDNLKDRISVSGGIYNYFMPSNIASKDRWIYCVLFESVRIGALLHDVGHPPFSHVTENALEAVYSQIEDGDINESINCFFTILKPYIEGDAKLHEEMGINIAKKLTLSAIKDLPSNPVPDENEYIKQLFEILVREIVIGILTEESNFFTDIHNIIDGTLDGDRLDYVTRDPLSSGLDVGKIEYDRLINSMKLCSSQDRFIFCPSMKVVNTLDDYFKRRLDIYKKIIYHHRVVKTDYLLQEIITQLSLEYLRKNKDKNKDNDVTKGNEDVLPYDISGIWMAVKNQISEFEYSNSLIQWDDSWLITILKKHYFIDYYNQNTILSYKLKELLTNEKSYYSIIKNKEDFGSIDLAIAEGLNRKYSEIDEIIKLLNEKSRNFDVNEKKVNIYGYYFEELRFIREKIKRYLENKCPTDIDGYILPIINSKLFLKKVNPLGETLKKAINRIKEIYKNYFMDIAVIHKDLTTGIGKPLYIYKEDDIILYKNVSSVPKILQYDINFHQCLYIYVLNNEGKSYYDCKDIYKDFREKIGQIIGEEIANNIKEQLLKFNTE